MAAARDTDADLRPRDQLIAELRDLCAGKRTGTLFIITIENHLAQIVLRDGEIVALSYRLTRGPDALAALKAFGAARYRFQSESVQPADPRLPSTAELLAALGGESGPIPAPAQRPPASEPTPMSAPRPVGIRPPTDAGRSQDAGETVGRLRPLIERELAEFLGPMAPLICDEHLAGRTGLGPQEISKVVEAIAGEIGDPAKEAQFKQRVLAQVIRG
jgi:hypothetical protein